MQQMNYVEEEKGLFTFYREQEEMEEEIKLQQKINRQQQLLKRAKQLDIIEEKNRPKRKSFSPQKALELSQPKKQKKYREQIYPLHKPTKISLGQSVIIVNTNLSNIHPPHLNNKVKTSLGRYQEKVQNEGHFVEVKQLQMKEKLTSVEGNGRESLNQQKKEQRSIRQKERGNKLPQIGLESRHKSELIIPKKYKSKKVAMALKADSSQLIRQIRESLQEESLQQIKDVKVRNIKKQPRSEELSPLFNFKQKKLFDILNFHLK